MKKAVIIRISSEARKRIKTKAVKKDKSMIDYVDELSKVNLTDTNKSVVS